MNQAPMGGYPPSSGNVLAFRRNDLVQERLHISGQNVQEMSMNTSGATSGLRRVPLWGVDTRLIVCWVGGVELRQCVYGHLAHGTPDRFATIVEREVHCIRHAIF